MSLYLSEQQKWQPRERKNESKNKNDENEQSCSVAKFYNFDGAKIQ
jgi:hypothetical protein